MRGAFETGAPPGEGGSGARPVGRAPLGLRLPPGGGRGAARAGRARGSWGSLSGERGAARRSGIQLGLAVRAAGALPAGGGSGAAAPRSPLPVAGSCGEPNIEDLKSSPGHFGHFPPLA